MDEDWTAPRFSTLLRAVAHAVALAKSNREGQVIVVIASEGRAGFDVFSTDDFENLKAKGLLYKSAPIGAVNGYGRFEFTPQFFTDGSDV